MMHINDLTAFCVAHYVCATFEMLVGQFKKYDLTRWRVEVDITQILVSKRHYRGIILAKM